MERYAHSHTGKQVITWDHFGKMCQELAKKIQADFIPDIVVGIVKAGVLPGVVIASLFRKDFYTIKLSRRSNDRVVHARPILFVPVTDSVFGKKILLVDEISITGETLKMAKEEILNKQAKEVRTATMFVHSYSFKPDWFALESDALIINPWDHYVLNDFGELTVHPEYVEEDFPDKN